MLHRISIRRIVFLPSLLLFCFCSSLYSQAPAKPASPSAPKWNNLLDSLTINKESSVGVWQKTKSGLQVTSQEGARIELPVQPTAEYDFQVTFTRHSGMHSIALIFTVGESQVTFDIDGWGQHLTGIQQIAGQDMRQYPNQVSRVTLVNGKKYQALVQVRKNRIQAWLDGKLIHSLETKATKLGLLNLWKLPHANTLGLGAWDATTTFHTIEYRSRNTAAGKIASSGTTTTSPSSATPNPAPSSNSSDELVKLSDDFQHPASLKNWLRVYQIEKTAANQLQRIDIGESSKGWMTFVPYTSTWYKDYRGILVHKRVKGDFVVTTRVKTSNRTGRGAPRSQYSLAGIMIRTPRNITPATWKPGGENYLFLSHGAANQPGTYQLEVKTTRNSDSRLEIKPTQYAEVEIRIARLGNHFILFRKDPNSRWQVHRRYFRSDMPQGLQVGMTVYTDYGTASRIPAAQHNRTIIRTGNPDLIASFDYFRFHSPVVPSSWKGKAISNSRDITDTELLRVLCSD